MIESAVSQRHRDAARRLLRSYQEQNVSSSGEKQICEWYWRLGDAHEGLRYALQRLGDPREGLKNAIQDRNHLGFWVARFFNHVGASEFALSLVQSLEPKTPEHHAAYADIYLANDQIELALIHFQQAAEPLHQRSDRWNAMQWLGIADCYCAQGDTDSALQIADAIANASNGLIKAISLQASAMYLWFAKDPAGAAKLLRQARENFPTNSICPDYARLVKWEAILLAHEGDFIRAEVQFREAIRILQISSMRDEAIVEILNCMNDFKLLSKSEAAIREAWPGIPHPDRHREVEIGDDQTARLILYPKTDEYVWQGKAKLQIPHELRLLEWVAVTQDYGLSLYRAAMLLFPDELYSFPLLVDRIFQYINRLRKKYSLMINVRNKRVYLDCKSVAVHYTTAQFLQRLSEKQRFTASQLQNAYTISKSGAGRVLDRWTQIGLVQKSRDSKPALYKVMTLILLFFSVANAMPFSTAYARGGEGGGSRSGRDDSTRTRGGDKMGTRGGGEIVFVREGERYVPRFLDLIEDATLENSSTVSHEAVSSFIPPVPCFTPNDLGYFNRFSANEYPLIQPAVELEIERALNNLPAELNFFRISIQDAIKKAQLLTLVIPIAVEHLPSSFINQIHVHLLVTSDLMGGEAPKLPFLREGTSFFEDLGQIVQYPIDYPKLPFYDEFLGFPVHSAKGTLPDLRTSARNIPKQSRLILGAHLGAILLLVRPLYFAETFSNKDRAAFWIHEGIRQIGIQFEAASALRDDTDRFVSGIEKIVFALFAGERLSRNFIETELGISIGAASIDAKYANFIAEFNSVTEACEARSLSDQREVSAGRIRGNRMLELASDLIEHTTMLSIPGSPNMRAKNHYTKIFPERANWAACRGQHISGLNSWSETNDLLIELRKQLVAAIAGDYFREYDSSFHKSMGLTINNEPYCLRN